MIKKSRAWVQLIGLAFNMPIARYPRMRLVKARSLCHSECSDTALMPEVVVVLTMQIPRSATQHTHPGEQALES